MKILLLGSGGREHAMAWKISTSPLCSKLFIAPGNAGTRDCGENIPLNLKDFPGIAQFVNQHGIGLVVVGPEEPLVNGLVDYFLNDEKTGRVLILGPSAKGAQLEGSKDFAKSFMVRHAIPTAAYRSFEKEQVHEAEEFLKTLNPPYVLKADGLAAGKGVIIPETLAGAQSALQQILVDSKFGSAGNKIVIEEFLRGIELSVFVLTDGNTYTILPEAKDYKRIGENDQGLNTGGMGAVSPVPFADKSFMAKVEERIIRPTVNGLKEEGIYYRGFIFIGLMKVGDDPFVIEYNVRMGDPETEVVFPRLESDVVDLLCKTAGGKLGGVTLQVMPETAVTVVMVSGGYPGDYEKGKRIDFRGGTDKCLIFHAGTEAKEGKIFTSGGRVLAVTSFGKDVAAAREKSYRQIQEINFENAYYRKDIGADLM